MWKLAYSNGSTIVESYFFPTKALAYWKKRQLVYGGSHRESGFIITKTN